MYCIYIYIYIYIYVRNIYIYIYIYIYINFYELYELNQTVLFLFPNLSKNFPTRINLCCLQQVPLN